MAVMFRPLRLFTNDISKKSKGSTKNPRKKQNLQVTISKEPPTILYFERSQDEQCCECIFDPLVLHDEEKDHPDLFAKNPKPWQKYPYCNEPSSFSADNNLIKKIISVMRIKS
ncbi:unnamed protein product [Cunninghamella echinulata]